MGRDRSIGCSQEMHLPNCGHFGESGTYLSAHAEWCPAHDNDDPCTCNPDARKKARKTELAKIEKVLSGKRFFSRQEISYNDIKRLAKFILKYAESLDKKKIRV